MSGLRSWDIRVYRNSRGVPMFSLGIHVDLHTPTLDIHLPDYTVQIGRNHSENDRRRFVRFPTGPWNGHSDNCDHPR